MTASDVPPPEDLRAAAKTAGAAENGDEANASRAAVTDTADAPDAAEPADATRRGWRPSRRGFLIGLGAAGVAVALGWRVGLPYARRKIAEGIEESGAPGGVDAPPDAWFDVLEPGGPVQVRLHVPKVEMGQGIHTALGQIAAEELELPFEQLAVVQASTARGIDDAFGTGASNSVSGTFRPLREAAAMLRTALVQRAASRWGVEPGDVAADAGRLLRVGDGATMSFSEAAAGAEPFELPDEPPALKPARAFRLIGTSPPRVDLRSKLTGEAVYGLDQRVDGMLYGAVARPPRIGARLASAGVGDAAGQPGVVSVVVEDGFAGIVADTRARAHAALEHLDLAWEGPDAPVTQDRVERLATVKPGAGTVIQVEGNVPRQLARREGRQRIERSYRTPMAAHAHLEPQSALADVRADGARLWVATQSPALVRDEVAELLDRPEDEVEVQATYLGGGFGRRLNVVVAGEAARLSRAAGRPVHVTWTREEEFRHGYVRPPTHHVLRASVEAGGRIAALEHEQASGDVAFISFPPALEWVFGVDFGAWRGAMLAYGGIPHRRTRAQRVRLPVPTGWWRGLGLLANTFAIESFVDELAHAAGADPLAFRLAHLDRADPLQARAAAVLERAASEAGWGEDPPAGRARGIAWSADVKTVVAQVAEVSLHGDRPRVHRMTVAIDPGLAIHPDGIAAQAQGSVMMGLSSALDEDLQVEDGNFAPRNFDRYPMLRIPDAPDVDVHVISSGDEPYGVGEPPLGPVAAAVGNALFALTGERARSLPLRVPPTEG